MQDQDPFFGVWQPNGQSPRFDVIVQFEAPDAFDRIITDGAFTPNTFFQQYIRSIIVKLKPGGFFFASVDYVYPKNRKAFKSIDVGQMIDDYSTRTPKHSSPAPASKTK